MNKRIERCYSEIEQSKNKYGVTESLEIPYLIFDVAGEDEALSYALENVEKTLYGMQLESVSINEMITNNIFKVLATYEIGDKTNSGDSGDNEDEQTTSFDCSASSQHVTTAKAQVQLFGDDQDIGNLIGWNGDKENPSFSGVETYLAVSKITINQTMSASRLTVAFQRKIHRMTGKVNASNFKGYEDGELLFLGASYSGTQSNEKVTVSYNFAIQFEEKFKISGKTFNKKGWQYLWCCNKPYNFKTKKMEVKGIWIAQIFDTASFKELGIK